MGVDIDGRAEDQHGDRSVEYEEAAVVAVGEGEGRQREDDVGGGEGRSREGGLGEGMLEEPHE